MIINRGLNTWNLLVCKLMVRMTKSQKPQEATNIRIIDENMGKHRIEALGFPKLCQQDASTSLKSILGSWNTMELPNNMHVKRWLHSLQTEQQCTGSTCRDKGFNPGDKCFTDQLNTARDFQLTNNCKIIFQFVSVEYSEV